ncbi:MAG: LysM peptidoglycan-binding domain-containing protein [Hyphomicrobiaceae bacterium]
MQGSLGKFSGLVVAGLVLVATPMAAQAVTNVVSVPGKSNGIALQANKARLAGKTFQTAQNAENEPDVATDATDAIAQEADSQSSAFVPVMKWLEESAQDFQGVVIKELSVPTGTGTVPTTQTQITQATPDEPATKTPAGQATANVETSDITKGMGGPRAFPYFIWDTVVEWFASSNRDYHGKVVRELELPSQTETIQSDNADENGERANQSSGTETDTKASAAVDVPASDSKTETTKELTEDIARMAKEAEETARQAMQAAEERQTAEAEAKAKAEAEANAAQAEVRARAEAQEQERIRAEKQAIAEAEAAKVREEAEAAAKAEAEAQRLAAEQRRQQEAAEAARVAQAAAEAEAERRRVEEAARLAEERRERERIALRKAEQELAAARQKERDANARLDRDAEKEGRQVSDEVRILEATRLAANSRQTNADEELAAALAVERRREQRLARVAKSKSRRYRKTKNPRYQKRARARKSGSKRLKRRRSKVAGYLKRRPRARHRPRARKYSCRYREGRRVRRLPGRYTVKKGDTLWKIARRHYRSGHKYRRIVRANRGKFRNSNRIYPCQRLYLPKR